MFKFLLKWLLIVLLLIGLGWLAWLPIKNSIAERNRPRWRVARVERGDITEYVNATGTIKPVKSVQVGSFISGPIKELFAEFNQEVKANDLLAKVDPRLFDAAVALDKARLATAKAEVLRAEALLQQARNDENRANRLRERNASFIPQAELDQVKFNRMSLEAQLEIAKASVEQAQASLQQSLGNLEFSVIRAPEDGIIIDRKVELGQTLAAQFQTPEMFVLGVGMKEKMYVFADVDESEIGLVRKAKAGNQPVSFTVSAYPEDLFEGTIEEVRYSSTTNQNVVTYPVVVATRNPELKLLPGMTANLSFQIHHEENVIKVPQAAIRFYPPDPKHVHPDDRKILETGASDFNDDTMTLDANDQSAKARVDAAQSGKRRHVWRQEKEFLRAVEVRTGIRDDQFVSLVSGDLSEGVELVTGLKAAGEE
jgi:HlyD family secretion protein